MEHANLNPDASSGVRQPRFTDGSFAVVPLRDRFESKFVVLPDGCWSWGATRDPSGVGRFWLDGRLAEAHRVSYEMYVGPIPTGWVVSHSCRNLWCVNPSHLIAQEKPRPRQPEKTYHANVYSSSRWKAAREAALLRDGRRCTVARFFGESCNGTLHVHHVVPLNDGGDPFDINNLGTACARHHAQWEALRAEVVRSLSEELRHRLRCPHQHRTSEGRRICEARMARQRGLVAA